MSKYNKVYFLHIPKTGGRFLTKYILRPIEEQLLKNNIELVRTPEDMRQHAGWPSWIDDQTYIISLFRDPCEFFVSAVSHSVAIKNNLVDQNNWNVIKNNNNDFRVDKSELYDALEKWSFMKDFQSQNFILSPNVEMISILQYARIKYESKESVNKDEIYKRIKRINLMIRHKDLKFMNYDLLVNKISEDLGINIKLETTNVDKEYFKNKASEILFNSLTVEDKSIICENFKLDKEIYDNDSLFWVPS